MYTILSGDEDNNDKVVGKDEAFIHPIIDGNIGNKCAQTNKAKSRTTQTGEKLSSQGQKSAVNNIINEENDAVLHFLRGK